MTIYPVIKKKRNKADHFHLFRFKSVPVQQEEDVKLPKKVVRLVREGREFYDFVDEKYEVHSIDVDSAEILKRLNNHKVSDNEIIQKIEEYQKHSGEIRLVLDAREKDPGLIHQNWMFLKYPDYIKIASGYVQQCIGPTNTVVYTHNEKITAKYPYEHLKHCSHEANDLWLDAQALMDIYLVVTEDRDAEIKFITVGDVGSGRAAVARVKVGSDMYAIVQNIFGIIPDEGVFTGTGIMKGYAVAEGEKVTGDTTFVSYCTIPVYSKEAQCSKCGQCRKICPAGLVPGDIVTAIETKNTAYLEKVDFSKCSSCGMCSYVCDQDRMLSQKILEYKEN